MAERKKLPVGLENFPEIRKSDFYYIDKTTLIEQLLESWSQVNLFTRPRRFGKTLTMSMLKSFFEIGTDAALFDGLSISKNQRLCEQYLGKYPVIFLSLKSVDGLTFEEAKASLCELIASEARRFKCLKSSDRLDEYEKKLYYDLIVLSDDLGDVSGTKLKFSIKRLSELLYKHFGQKTIILLDEYDVPLDKAFQHGYYREMVSLIRGLFGEALKTNSFLQFAVLTGCLRVSKESIFTGLNNFKVYASDDVRYDEAFGFTGTEVEKLLADYGLSEHFQEVKEWYDGYRFGNADIYCPWDVINYVDDLVANPEAKPKAYWINSSGNDLVKRLIDQADTTTRDEIEQLIAGNAVEKNIRLDLTYEEIDSSIENMWSVLFTTGYLTKVDSKRNMEITENIEDTATTGMEIMENTEDTVTTGNMEVPAERYDGAAVWEQTGYDTNQGYRLVIPNKEVREVFVLQIRDWFNRVVTRNHASTEKINRGFLNGNVKDIQQELTMFLGETISILDTKARNEEKEIFYHGILLGILKSNPDWAVKSNRESGDGFADILIKPKNPDTGIVIELKYARTFSELDLACEKALQQIKDRRYDEVLREDGREDILVYGIAFCKKRCKVEIEKSSVRKPVSFFIPQ